MVVFLYLDTEMENFQANWEDGTFIWDMNNLELPAAGSVALSSINISFTKNASRIKISSNLIQPNFLNPDSVIASYPPTRVREISNFFSTLQFYKIDTTNPRMIVLKFHNANISIIRFAAFTFAIC